MTDQPTPQLGADAQPILTPNPGLVPPIVDKGGIRVSRRRNLRRTANLIAKELEVAVTKCRNAGGNCQTLEAALAAACKRLGGCGAADSVQSETTPPNENPSQP